MLSLDSIQNAEFAVAVQGRAVIPKISSKVHVTAALISR
jgi:hypothetical protein